LKGRIEMYSEIYYFTGTGNSLAISRQIDNSLTEKSRIISIPQCSSDITTAADRIGIVFPVYFVDVPSIVKQFISRIAFTKLPYIFAVATCNSEPGHSLFTVNELLKKNGQVLSLGKAVNMPSNAVFNTLDEEQEKLETSIKRVAEIVEDVEVQRKNDIEGVEVTTSAYNTELSPELYQVSASCTACGTCEKVCPIGNISIKDGKPTWKNKCENCLACFHWCPNEAISIDYIIKNRRKYHHPEVTLADMLQR